MSIFSWRAPLTRWPCTGLCPRLPKLPARTSATTRLTLTQRGSRARGGTAMTPGLRMSSGPRCRCPRGNDQQAWISCRVTIPGAHIIGKMLHVRLVTVRVVNSAKGADSSVGGVPVCNCLGVVHMEEEVQDRVQLEVGREEQRVGETHGKEQGEEQRVKERTTAQHG